MTQMTLMNWIFRILYPEYLCSFDGRKIRGVEINALWPSGENFAIGLGGSSGFFPSRIATKAAPILFGLIRIAEMGNDVDQRIGFTLVGIHWRPVGDIRHVMILEDLTSMVAESCM